jgi:hypothetical protein
MADLANLTQDQLFAALRQGAESEQRTHATEVHEIVEAGRALHGNQTFDEASQVVAGVFKEPEQLGHLMGTLRQFDRPADVIMHLANNEGRLQSLAKLSPARQAVEIAKIEGEMSSFGRAATGADRAWKNPDVRRGVVSEESWRKDGGAALTDDAAWSRAFDKRMASRSKTRFV